MDWRFSRGGLTDFALLPFQVSDKFAFGLFDLDWDVFTQHIEGAINRVPVLEKTGIKSTVCGPGEWGCEGRNRGNLESLWMTAFLRVTCLVLPKLSFSLFRLWEKTQASKGSNVSLGRQPMRPLTQH